VASPRDQHTYMPATDADGGREAHRNISERGLLRSVIRGPILVGISCVMLLIVGFAGWASTSLLASGATAPGLISPDTSRKTVQHLDPGIIDEIFIRDGDYVVAGAPLLRLEDTATRATYIC